MARDRAIAQGGTMKNVIIKSITTDDVIPPKELLGDDYIKVIVAIKIIKENWLNPYYGCYKADVPSLEDFRKKKPNLRNANRIVSEYALFIEQWYKDHPDEIRREEGSRKLWEKNNEKQFNIVYNTAIEHGLYMKWLGTIETSSGNMWDVFSDKERIARIYC